MRILLSVFLLINIAIPVHAASWWAMQNASSGGSGACISGNDANMVFLIQSNTTDGSTTFVDSAVGGTSTYTITVVNAVHHETDAFKWGTSSIEYAVGTQDYLKIGNSEDFNFGTGDFTMELWARWKTNTSLNAINTDSNQTWGYTSDGNYAFDDTIVPGTHVTVPWSPSMDTWYHLAVERSGDTLIIYVSGVSMASTDLAGKAINWNDIISGEITIGRYNPTIGGVNFDGYLDEIAIHKGVAKHSGAASYDVPIGPYCD